MASHRWWKSIWYGLLFFSFFDIVVRAFSCPRLHNAFCRHQNKKRRNKNTFKERVKFPILECTVEIGETKHSRIVVELSGWLSLPWYTSSTPCVVSLWAKTGIFGTRKTYENLTSSFLLFYVFCLKRPWRHQCRIKYPCQMCSPQTWVGFHLISRRGHCGASFIELLRHANTLKFSHDIQVPQLVALLLSHRSQEACVGEEGKQDLHPPSPSLLRFTASSLSNVVVILK